MKRIKGILVFSLVFALILSIQIYSVSVNAAPSTSGIKGVNNPHIWFDSQAYTALDTIKSNGFNTVRVVWQTSGTGSRLGEIISRCKALGLKPIPELHDITGGTGDTNGSNVDRMVSYWVTNKSYIPSDVWINIANEWGPANSTVWRDAYINGIKTMRNAGITNTIVVDAGGWGQDDQDILNYGPAILSADSNVVFSIHMYGSWNDNSKVSTFLNSCKSKGLPIMVGEFGYNYNNGSNNLSCKVDAAYVMSTCASLGIGYIGWSWCGNNAENAWLDMTASDWKTLNTWGTMLKNGGGGSTQPPITPTPTPTPTAGTPLPGGIKVQFFNGNTATTTNTIYPNFKVVNTGNAAINLSDVKVRYYFTNDGTQADSFSCDYSTIGSGNVTSSFATIAKTNADRYLEVGFTSGAGALCAGAGAEVKGRVWKSDWSNFTQTNDYSFNATATNYVDSTTVTGYIAGALKWGTEP